ncbi:unnamed protein product [Caretta caretta]
MPTNKSPGMDGLTVEFYRTFWDILGPDLVTVWAESLQSGVLPLSCRLNWTLTEPVSFGRGVRQGCPLSGQLYALVIEPFLCLLRRRMTGLVLRELELRLVLLAYANDVLLVVQDPGDLARVEACQAIYSAASSARVNWVKSSGLAVGDWRQGLEWLQFYQQVYAFLGTLDSHECLVLGGDFNTTLEKQDRSGTEQSPAAADTLWEIVEHHSLVDIWRDHHPDDTSTFTFVRVEAHRSSHSRLDRIYLSRFHLSQAHSSSIRLAPFSDHHLATMTASFCAERPGPAYWRFNNSLLEDEGFVTSFQESSLACDYTWGTSRRRNAAIEQLEQEVLQLERRLTTSPEDPLLCGACREKWGELRALEDHWARATFVRSRIRLLWEMDRGSRFFYALEKTRGAKKHVTCLLSEDGTPLTEPVEMCGRARAFYARSDRH